MGNIYRKKIASLFSKPWPYWFGGFMLGVLNIGMFYFTDEPIRVSTGFLCFLGGILEKIGVPVFDMYYFSTRDVQSLRSSFMLNRYVIIMFGIIFGSLISTFLSSDYKFKKIKNSKQVIFGIFGGILMGYGTRVAYGCNLGAYLSAIPSYSLHGWVFGLAMFAGAYIGSKLLTKYIL